MESLEAHQLPTRGDRGQPGAFEAGRREGHDELTGEVSISAVADGPTADLPLWQRQADQWSRVRPPLRPSGDDLVWAQRAVDLSEARTAVVLGVTPELAALRWCEGTRLLLTDHSLAMILALWHGPPPAVTGAAALADWRRLPVAGGAAQLVLGDGSFNALRHAQRGELAASVRRVLCPGGIFGLRSFVRPEKAESAEAVCRALLDGAIGSFHIFKFRLLMSLHDAVGEVRVADAWDTFSAWGHPMDRLAADLGWPLDEIRTIEAYRGQPDVYWFPTTAELEAALEEDFVIVERRVPSYEMGDRCPTYLLRRR
jgi:hypothetical protein